MRESPHFKIHATAVSRLAIANWPRWLAHTDTKFARTLRVAAEGRFDAQNLR